MDIRKKIIVISLAKLLMINNYDLKKTGIAFGLKADSQLMEMLNEIMQMSFHYEEILFVLNEMTSFGGQDIADITDYSNTHISIQKWNTDREKLEKKVDKFNGIPIFSDSEYKKLMSLIFAQHNLWSQVHRTLFTKLKITGRMDECEVEQPDNFLEAARETVSWVILDSLDRFTLNVNSGKVKVGVKKVLHSLNDDNIDLNINLLNKINARFKTKPRLRPTWKEASIAFNFLGFKTRALTYAYRIIAAMNEKPISKSGISSSANIWKKEKYVLTQLFDDDNITSEIYKFLVAMNRIKTKGNKYYKKFEKTINMLNLFFNGN